MTEFKRNNAFSPYMGEVEYQVVHDSNQQLLHNVTSAIDELFTCAESPISFRQFNFERDSSHSFLETIRIVDDNDDTSKVTVEQTLSIVHTTCKPPRSVIDYYHVRIADRVAIATQPVITEYYIEQLPTGLYFGMMRRLDLSIDIDNSAQSSVMYGDEEPMTLYDLNDLHKTLEIHYNYVQQESAHADLIRNYEYESF